MQLSKKRFCLNFFLKKGLKMIAGIYINYSYSEHTVL